MSTTRRAAARTDAIDLSTAVIAPPDCPDVRTWPIVTTLTRLHLADREQYSRGNVNVEFPERAHWPAAVPTGWASGISYTLWLGLSRGGVWYVAPIVECIGDYIPTGPLFAPRQVAENLLYYPMQGIQGAQPASGELVAWFITTGDTRRMNLQAQPQGRSAVVTTPFIVGDYAFTTPLPPVPPPGPPPVPPPGPPVTPPPLPPPPDLWRPAVEALRVEVEALRQTVTSQEIRIAELERRDPPAVTLPTSVRIYGIRVPVTWS